MDYFALRLSNQKSLILIVLFILTHLFIIIPFAHSRFNTFNAHLVIFINILITIIFAEFAHKILIVCI